MLVFIINYQYFQGHARVNKPRILRGIYKGIFDDRANIMVGSGAIHLSTSVNYGEISLIHWIDDNIYVQSAASQLTRSEHNETL